MNLDRTLEYCVPAWLDDILLGTRGNKNNQKRGEFFSSSFTKRKRRDTERVKKSDFLMNKTKMLGHGIDENGMKLNEEKVEAVKKLNPP